MQHAPESASATPAAAAPHLARLAPGVLLCFSVAALALWLGQSEWLSRRLHVGPLLLVILLGMALRTAWRIPDVLTPGVRSASRALLRWGVAGLGFKLSLPELLHYGGGVLAVVAISTVASAAFGWWIALRMGLNEKLALLLGVGGGVCGASAIVAADSVIESDKRDSIVAVATITLLGTLGIVLYPWLAVSLGLAPFTYGAWCGATLHETAQVVAAAAAAGDESKVVATAVKLARICLLAPIVLAIGWYVRRRFGRAGVAQVAPVPWFLVLFVVFAIVQSFPAWFGNPPRAWFDLALRVDLWLLCAGMAGVGLQAGFSELRDAGARLLLAGAAQWLFLALVALGLIAALC